MEETKDNEESNEIKDTEYCKNNGSSKEEGIIELSCEELENEDVEDVTHLDIITYELKVSRSNLLEKLNQWKEVRKHTVKSLRELADYLDNIGGLANVVVAMRGSALDRGIAVGSGILTFAVGVSIPFLIAGAGIGLASFISRAVGVGGGLIGTCLGVVGGVLTVATAGAALPVVVAGVGLWFASGIARWVGAGGGLVARGITLVGRAVIVFAASTAVVVCLGGAGLWLAIPAITREVQGSRYVETVTRYIGEDVRVTEQIVEDLDYILEKAETENLSLNLETVRQAISSQIIVLLDGGLPSVWDIKQLQNGMKKLVQDWKEGSTHIRVIADQLEEVIGMVSEKDLEF